MSMKYRHCFSLPAAFLLIAAIPCDAQSVWQRVQKAAKDAAQSPNRTTRPAPAPAGERTRRVDPRAGSAPPTSAPAPLTARPQETLLGPGSGRMWVSDDGAHVAIATLKGSRSVMLVDGVEGPEFDELGQTGTGVILPVSFSAGGRCAYLGRRGDWLIPVVDGKEAPPVANTKGGTPQSISLITNLFRPDRPAARGNGLFHFNPAGCG